MLYSVKVCKLLIAARHQEYKGTVDFRLSRIGLHGTPMLWLPIAFNDTLSRRFASICRGVIHP